MEQYQARIHYQMLNSSWVDLWMPLLRSCRIYSGSYTSVVLLRIYKGVTFASAIGQIHRKCNLMLTKPSSKLQQYATFKFDCQKSIPIFQVMVQIDNSRISHYVAPSYGRPKQDHLVHCILGKSRHGTVILYNATPLLFQFFMVTSF